MTTSTEGITLLGAEMLTWSDADGALGAFGGLLAPQLLHGFGGARDRALVAGPTTAAVIRDVAGHFTSTDVLVRSWLDAQRLRAELPAEIGVFCGPLDRMVATGATYDAVIAVAGTDRLLALGGTSRHTDADWPDGHVVDRPSLDAAATADLLEQQHGLTPVETWCCHGPRSAPQLVASAATLTELRTDAVLVREVARAYQAVDPSAPVLKDPVTTVRDLVGAGLGAAVAPVTVLHLQRGPQAAPTVDGSVLIQEPAHDGAPAVAYRLSRTAAGWERTLLAEPVQVQVGQNLVRDTAALEGMLPTGPTLAEQIEACCVANDAAAAGVAVRRLRDWLGIDEYGVLPADRVAVLAQSLVVTDAGVISLDRSWSSDLAVPREAVLVRALLVLAADLLGRGVRHPGSAAASPWELAVVLATAAGIEDDEELRDLRDVVLALDSRLRADGSAPDYDAPAATARLPYAELVEVAEGLATRAADADAHVLWLLRRVQGRQRAFRKARSELAALNSSREVRVGRKVFWVRDKLRRRNAAAAPPVGEWSGPSEKGPEPLQVPSNLVPPGYRPPPEVTVLPPEEL